MNIKQFLTYGASTMLTLVLCGSALADEKGRVVRLAKLQIDAAQLESYKAALKEEIETSVRVEPGVLALYAVSEKDNPAHIMVFEIYADADAYKAHLEMPHFKKYKLSPSNSSRLFPFALARSRSEERICSKPKLTLPLARHRRWLPARSRDVIRLITTFRSKFSSAASVTPIFIILAMNGTASCQQFTPACRAMRSSAG
jgi:quinol monooxygenase YgiN